LLSYAQNELSEGAFPCAAVDTLIYWLVQRRKIPAAKDIHEKHFAALTSRSADDLQSAFEAMEARRSLLDSYARFPKVPLRSFRVAMENVLQ
jgi:hypothetical protein